MRKLTIILIGIVLAIPLRAQYLKTIYNYPAPSSNLDDIGINLSDNLSDAMIAHWTFDNDSINKVFDASGNGYGGISQNVSYSDGVIGKAIVFNNAGARVYIPNKNSNPPDSIGNLAQGSISLWFKYQNVGSNILPIFYFGESDKNGEQNSLIIEIGHHDNIQNRKLYFTIINKRFCFDSGQNLEQNKWYHFVAVVGPDNNTGYLNGVELNKMHYNLGSDSTYSDFFADVSSKKMMSFGYGRYGLSDNFFTFKGAIDDIRIFNKPLNTDEVKQLYLLGDNSNGKPTYANVSYGKYERNILDFWQAKSDKPTPVVVFIHGGGFRAGSKTNIQPAVIEKCLANGVSVAAVEYRFRQTTRLDTIILDCARAIQFLRYKAGEWNIDKNKFASYGGSAGGGASIWLAFHDDLANSSSEDPVLRESSRLTVVGHLTSQATYDFEKWSDIVDVPDDWMEIMHVSEDLDLYHIPDRTHLNDPDIIKLRKFLDMPSFLDKDDPPCYFLNMNSQAAPANAGAIIHHPKHAIYLKHLYDSLGIDAAIVLNDTPVSQRVDMLDFFFKYLLGTTGVNEIDNSPSNIDLKIYPNPSTDIFSIDYYLQSSSFVNISLYNLLGNKVVELANEFQISGKHHYTVNNSNLEENIYFCVLKSKFGTISKMLVRKK